MSSSPCRAAASSWLFAGMGSSKKAPKTSQRKSQRGKDRKKRRSSSSSSGSQDSTFAEVKAIAETFGLSFA